MKLNELSRDILKEELKSMGISYVQFENYDGCLKKIIIRKCIESYQIKNKNDNDALTKVRSDEDAVFMNVEKDMVFDGTIYNNSLRLTEGNLLNKKKFAFVRKLIKDREK